jgi:hypothetical protein
MQWFCTSNPHSFHNSLVSSVADLDPVSFLPMDPGSGARDGKKIKIRILDPDQE